MDEPPEDKVSILGRVLSIFSENYSEENNKHQNQHNIPFGKVLVAIAVTLLLLAAARVLCCPVSLSPEGMAFVKWTLSTAISVLLGVGIARHINIV